MELKSIKKLSLTVNTVILIMVFGLMFFFHLCNVTFLVYFSIPTSMIYVIGYCLIHKNKLNIYVWLVFFWLTFYMGVTTICLGYDYGFHLYCFSMIPTMFVAEYMSYKLKKRSLWAFNVSILIAFFYLICTGYVASFGPVYEVNSKTASAFFWIFNAMTVFGFLIFYSKYLIYSIIKSEEKLSEIAHSDRLTQLYNRHYMLQQLEAVCEMDKDCFLAMADIDFFKKYITWMKANCFPVLSKDAKILLREFYVNTRAYQDCLSTLTVLEVYCLWFSLLLSAYRYI